MKRPLIILIFCLPGYAPCSELAERMKVDQVLQPTGRTCETFYSLHASDIACLKDVEYKRLFRVTYKVAGQIRTADIGWYPEKKFAVDVDGLPINPDTSMRFKTEHDQ